MKVDHVDNCLSTFINVITGTGIIIVIIIDFIIIITVVVWLVSGELTNYTPLPCVWQIVDLRPNHNILK